MRNYDTLFIPVKFNNHEFSLLIGTDTFSVFLCQMTVRGKTFQSIRQLYNSALIITAAHCSFMDGPDSKRILQCIPGIFLELFMSQLQLAVIFIDTHNDNINMRTNLRILAWMIKALQPAQVTDMDHTADTRRQFNKYTIIGNILYQACMTAAFSKFHFNIIPWIR